MKGSRSAGLSRQILDEIVTRTLWMERSAIEVIVADGVVTLKGHVDQRSLAEWLVELVEKVNGVVSVRSELGYLVDDVPSFNAPGLGQPATFAPAGAASHRPAPVGLGRSTALRSCDP